MPDFGIMRGFGAKLFSDKLMAGQLPTQLGLIGSESALLLDIYPNAAAAYALRKLRNTYLGNAIRVRRSSDNTEQDIGFSGFNLDTSALTSFCGVGNGFVTTWYDQSGNTRNITQTTASFQPQIVSSGNTIVKNTKPTLSFDGSNDYLTGGNILNLAQYTYLTVNSSNAIGNIQIIINKGYGSGYYPSWANFIISSKYRASVTYSGPAETTIFSTLTLSNDTLYLSSSIYNKLRIYSRTNGGNEASVAETRNIVNSTEPFTVGVLGSLTNYFLNGRISEIIIYDNSKLSDISSIESQINTYYGIY